MKKRRPLLAACGSHFHFVSESGHIGEQSFGVGFDGEASVATLGARARSRGRLQVTIDLAGKMGNVRKGVFVTVSNAPPESLTVEAVMSFLLPPQPVMSAQERARNMKSPRRMRRLFSKATALPVAVSTTANIPRVRSYSMNGFVGTDHAWAITNVSGTSQPLQVIDPNPFGQTQKFYRVQSPQQAGQFI